MARYVHRKSRRADKPFVSVNCAAIPENLLESELFGHEKGAFTGAVARRIGKFEEANGGTLLLDEISEMDLRLQAKLLRAIQEREIDRVGGSQPVKVDIRVLATSNRDLEEEVARRPLPRGPLLPPQRREPAPAAAARAAGRHPALLAEHFASKYAEANGVPERPLAAERLALLRPSAGAATCASSRTPCTAPCCWRAGDEIGADAIRLPDGRRRRRPTPSRATASARRRRGRRPPAGALVGRTVADVERDLILDTLDHCLGNRTHAANILGISIRTLRNKLKQYSEAGVARPAAGRRGAGAACAAGCAYQRAAPRHERPDRRRQLQRGGRCSTPPWAMLMRVATSRWRSASSRILVVLILPMPAFLLDIAAGALDHARRS